MPRGRWRVPLTAGAALLLGAAGFLFRLFATTSLPDDHYMHLAWAQQLLLGDVPGRDFVEVGMPLTVALSAAAQYLSAGPFSEIVLTAAMIGLAACLTCLAAARLSGSLWIGCGAALLELMFYPRLYNYPKLLVPAATLIVFDWYLRQRSPRRMWLLGVWTVIAVLLRHDLGVYAGLAIGAGLAAVHGSSVRTAARALGAYVAATALVALPYIGFVAATDGILEHVRGGREFSAADSHQLVIAWPSLPPLTLAAITGNAEDAAAMAFYAAYALAVAAALLLPIARSPEARSRAIAAVVLLAAYLPVILRHPLTARVPDIGSVVALVAAWTIAESVRALLQRRAGAAAVAVPALAAAGAAAVAALVVSAWTLGGVPAHWKATRLADGILTASDHMDDRRRAGTDWPWAIYWPAGEPPDAIRYLHQCTAPGDRFLVSWTAPHYYFFAQRGFAAGFPWFVMRGFLTDADQQLMIARLAAASVPVVLINETEPTFARAYPEVAQYIARRYMPAGRFTIRGGDQIVLMVSRGARAMGTDEATGWPCGFAPSPSAG